MPSFKEEFMSESHQLSSKGKTALLAVSLGALGVVYGDIGTSPLYAVNEVFFGHHRLAMTTANIIGLTSVVVWALTLIIAFKYIVYVLRADNDGEGGVFALFALLKSQQARVAIIFTALLVFAAGLLYGDGILTPAISVLSAIEGLKVATPSLAPYVLPITIVILTILFSIQRYGTATIGKFFGPIILVWFIVIALLGIVQITTTPQIFMALNPLNAVRFVIDARPIELMRTLGGVMLVITGGEALYADMGHFGRAPIRLSWFSVVMPCLILNYLGQGAFLLSGKEVVNENIFFSLVPSSIVFPMVILAAMATVIASQALISGVFSLTAQGIALGLLPRLRINHTHEHQEGQIYLNSVNWALYAGCVTLVLVFKSSASLANAYGLAVSMIMLITSLTMMLVTQYIWKWKPYMTFGLFIPFALIDAEFLTSNTLKVFSGGWVPLTIGITMFIIMATWSWGKAHAKRTFQSHRKSTVKQFIARRKRSPEITIGNVLVLSEYQPTLKSEVVPALVDLYVKKFHTIPKHLIMLSIHQIRHPYVDDDKRYKITVFEKAKSKNDPSLIAVRADFGFNEIPDVEEVIKYLAKREDLTPSDKLEDWIVYAGREKFAPVKKARLNLLTRMKVYLYSYMARNSAPRYEYFGLANDNRLTVEMVGVELK